MSAPTRVGVFAVGPALELVVVEDVVVEEAVTA
jgi:hypothetical protein